MQAILATETASAIPQVPTLEASSVEGSESPDIHSWNRRILCVDLDPKDFLNSDFQSVEKGIERSLALLAGFESSIDPCDQFHCSGYWPAQ